MMPTMSSLPDLAPLRLALRQTVREAGAMANTYFREGQKTSARIWSKAGGSPVTEADVAVDAFLKVALSRLLPEAGWLSEETADDPARMSRRLVWIVDPIDGTRAFLSGDRDWSVAVALLADGRPLIGLVEAPAHGVVYEALAGAGAQRNGQPIQVSRQAKLGGAGLSGPKPLIDHVERRVGRVERLARVPSLALRIARVAEGSIDVGLVSGNARDWDIAAADLILAEAGGVLSGFDGVEPAYNRPEPIHGELVAVSRGLHPAVIEAMTAGRDAAAQR
ncbi:MAG TPA: 3'(2'),5'-bisphosphate nucleotidase CysQ [Beijerinckiaceae bacterium]|jgi:myo-inositol-1(or 4)-monophosphatase